MREDVAELVVSHTTHVFGASTQRRHSHDGVRGGTSRDLHTGSHGFVQLVRALPVDEGHAALGDPQTFDQAVVLVAQHVHEGVADADDICLCCCGVHW